MHRFRNLTITTKLTWLFGLFAALLLIVVGALAYFSGRAAIEQAVISDLESTANEKQAALDRWLDDRLNLVVSITGLPANRARVTSLTRDKLDDAARQTLQAQTAQALAGFTGPTGTYAEMMIVEARAGQVIVSTRPENQGKFNEDRPYFIAGLTGPVVQNVVYSLDARAPLLILAAPLQADDGRVIAVLAARLKLDEMNDIILRRTGQRQTDDAFLVDTSHLFVTQPRFITDPAVLQRGVHTDPVNRCLAGNSGVLAANDYRSEPVLAVYRWLPERQLCLIVKLDQAEAFAPSNAFGQTLAVVALVALALASLLGLGLARTITIPIHALQDHVMRFGRGELDVRIPETTGDEVGVLAREFNRMAASLADKDAQLRDYAAGLERRVEERTAALGESEERFRSLYENSTVGIYRTTPAGRILLANPALVTMLGYASFDELANRDLEQTGFDPAYNRAQFVETIERDGQINGLEASWTRQDGVAIIVRESARAIRDPQGRTLYYDGTVIDITARKRAEGALAERHAVLSAVINSPGDMIIFSLDRHYCYTAFNERHRTEMRAVWQAEIAPGLNLLDLMTVPELRAGAQHSFDRVLHGESFTEIQHQPGLDIYYEFNWSPIRQTDGEVIGIAAFIRDITERRRLERERTLLANAIAASVNEVYLFDAETLCFTFVNDGALQNLHYTLAEMQHLTPLDLKPEFTAESFEQLIAPLRSRDQPVQVFETVHRRADGSLYPVEVHLQLFEHGDERVFLAIVQDITVRRAAEQEIRQLNAELEQRVLDRTAELEATNKELEAFTYSVSHDLRAPLRAIDGYTRILLEDYAAAFDDEGKHLANIVRDETQRMGRLIDDLLTLSRLTRTAMNLAPVDMQAMVYSIYHQLTTPEARARIDFRVSALPMAECDAILIQRAWENLLSNAIKFSGRRTRAVIEITGTATASDVTYCVRDNGAGFDMQYARKLFGVFQRLHSDKEFDGTGVGLAIVQRVVHRHGGRVWGEGQVDTGAAFYFALPIQRSPND